MRNRLENDFAKSGDGEKNKDDTVDKNENERVGVSETESETNGVNEERVQSHSRGLRERQISQKTDKNRADDRRDCRGYVNRVEGNRA